MILDRENVGLLGSTRVGSRRVIQISAGFMIFFSMLGEWQLFICSYSVADTYIAQLTYLLFRKIWSFICINTLPHFCSSVLCSVWPCGWVSPLHQWLSLNIYFLSTSLLLWQFFLFAASVGLSFLQFTNMNSMRNLFITGVALFLGFSVPEYFREYSSKALHGPTHTRAGWVSFLFHFSFWVFQWISFMS